MIKTAFTLGVIATTPMVAFIDCNYAYNEHDGNHGGHVSSSSASENYDVRPMGNGTRYDPLNWHYNFNHKIPGLSCISHRIREPFDISASIKTGDNQ